MKYFNFLKLSLIPIFSVAAIHAASAKSSWTYKAFPEIKAGKKLNFPLKVKLPSETLKARINPRLGTHPFFGVDQIYISKKFSKRILIKQGVKVSNAKVLGKWIELKNKTYVYHYPIGSTLIALYAQDFNRRELNLVKKQFVPRKFRHKFSSWILPTQFKCAFAEVGWGAGSGPPSREMAMPGTYSSREANRAAEADSGQGMVACLANKSKDQLIGQAQAVGDMATSAYDATSEALDYAYNNPMQAAGNTASFLYGIGESAVSGIGRGAQATWNAGRQLINDPRQVWENVNASIDRMGEFGRSLYRQASEAIDGFEGLDPAVRNRLICEFGGVIIAEGLVGAALGLTGAGASVAAAKFARLLNSFRTKVQRLMPAMRLLAQSNLSALEKQRLVSQLFNNEISLAEFRQRMSGPNRRPSGGGDDNNGGSANSGLGSAGAQRSTTASRMPQEDVNYLSNLTYESDFGKVKVMDPKDITLLSRADESTKITARIDDEVITGSPSEILQEIRNSPNARRIAIDGAQGQGNAALAGRAGLSKITDGQSTTGIEAFENISDDTALSVTVTLRNGESASFRGNKEMIVDLAETSNVDSIIVHTPPSWVRPLHEISDADLARAPNVAGLVRSNANLSTTTQANGLAGIRVHHGTIEGMADSVRAGPRNVGSGFGGRGVYLDLEADARIADAYASSAQTAAAARARTAGLSTTNTNPVVMTGRLNPDRNLSVFSFEVSRDAVRPDFERGILPVNWSDDPSIARYIEQNFDVVEVRNARSNNLNLDTDRFIVVHERAGADAIIWEEVRPAN